MSEIQKEILRAVHTLFKDCYIATIRNISWNLDRWATRTEDRGVFSLF